MKYSDEQLDEAVEKKIFSLEQVDSFREYVKTSYNVTTKPQKVLYYIGGLLIISAMTWLMRESWASFGAEGIAFISVLYFLIFLFAGHYIFFRKNLEIAGGLLLTIPVAITPLFTFSVLEILGYWPLGWRHSDYFIWIRGRWIILEIATLVVALPIFLKTKFPFHVFLIAGTLWFFSMDIVPVLHGASFISWSDRGIISIIFGLLMISVGYWADIKFKKDYAFWMYLFGLLTLSSGLSIFYNNVTSRLIFLGLVNILLILFALFINRNTFLVFGAIGLIQFLSRLAWVFFQGSIFFPFALTIIGLLLISLGIYFQKNRKRVQENIINKLPVSILNLRPKRK